MRYALVTLLLALLSHVAFAQDHRHPPEDPFKVQHHAQGHDEYKNWSSQKTGNCCNNDDCSEIHDTNVRSTPSGYEVAIDHQWCPVLREHWIIRGRSPNFTSYHGCIKKKTEWNNSTPACERLLCFAGKGGT